MSCYATAPCQSVCLCGGSRGLGGEEASPGVTLRLHHRESHKSKSINNVGREKLHSNLRAAECERLSRRQLGVKRPFPPANPRCDRGAQENTLPKCSPSRHRRNNMSAKDGHVLLVMSTRGGGKVDTIFLLYAFSFKRSQRTEVKLKHKGEIVQLTTWRTHCLSRQV